MSVCRILLRLLIPQSACGVNNKAPQLNVAGPIIGSGERI